MTPAHHNAVTANGCYKLNKLNGIYSIEDCRTKYGNSLYKCLDICHDYNCRIICVVFTVYILDQDLNKGINPINAKKASNRVFFIIIYGLMAISLLYYVPLSIDNEYRGFIFLCKKKLIVGNIHTEKCPSPIPL